MNKLKSSLIPILSALVIFIVLSVAYMAPVLQGKNIRQNDIVQHRGMSKEMVDFREEFGEEALWTNSIFGGMPAYLVSTRYESNLLKFFHRIFTLGNWRPVCFVFLYLLGAYLAFLAFGVNPWLSIVGAVAFAFSSYFFIIIEAGHISKVLALGYMPPIIGGVHLAFRRKYLLGGLMLGLFLSLQILVVHLQITYYTFLIILVYGIVELIRQIREKGEWKQFGLAVLTLSIAALLAVGSNLSQLWSTYEYGQYSIRGESELSVNEENKTSGLDKDYATQWSYGVGETFTLLIPNFNGGASGGALPQNSKTYELLKEIQGPATARKSIKQMPTYWGAQPFTSGPVYAGAIVVFLFVLGLFIIRGPLKWWVVAVTLLSIALAWGHNFQILTDFFLEYVPGYNKFRTVSMTLVMAEFTLPLLGILALNEVLAKNYDKKKLTKALLNSFYITGGLCLFFILLAPALFSFEAEMDQRYLAQGATEFVDALRQDRLMLLRRDAFRSFVFIALAAGIIYLYILEKVKTAGFISGVGILVLIDMWAVNKRYLNDDNFVSNREYENPISKSKADEFILRDEDESYRVLNLAVSPFQDATTSYFHKSIGGYHGAKMRRYQELMDHAMQTEMQQIISALQKGSIDLADSALRQSPALNMLNTRYIIYNPEAMPLINNFAAGNAWYPHEIVWVTSADEEIAKLPRIDVEETLLVDERFRDQVPEGIEISDSLVAEIRLQDYAPNKMVYESNSAAEAVVVFSEIYYPKGWQAYIDGEKVPHFRANFVLRAMVVPEGKHEIVFEFKPSAYYTGQKVGLISSGILLVLLLGAIVVEGKKTLQAAEA